MKVAEMYRAISVSNKKSLGNVGNNLTEKMNELKPLAFNIIFPSVFENNKVFLQAISESGDLASQNRHHAISNGGGLKLLKFSNGIEVDKVADYRNIPFELLDFDPKDANIENQPAFVPIIRLMELDSKYFVPDALRIDNDTYLFTSKYDFKKPQENVFSLLTLDQLVSTVEYYYNRQKRVNANEAEFKTESLKKQYLSYDPVRRASFYSYKFRYTDLPIKTREKISFDQWEAYSLEQKEAVSLPIKLKVKPVTTKFGKVGSRMPLSYHTFYENVIDPSTKMKTRFANPVIWKYYEVFSKFLAWKILDFAVIRKGNAENANKAFQTSFGRIGATEELYAEYGIFIKRQNGAAIQEVEVNDIDQSLQMAFKTFGNFSPELQNRRTVISHANLTHMYARKAIGIFVPNIPAIGISRIGGERQFFSTASHEYAHFLDYFRGTAGWYNSMNYESLEGKIAAVFRENMRGRGKASEYFNSTIECFARAMQQYFTMKWFPDHEFGHFSMINIERPNIITETMYYCSEENFNNNVKPIIEEWVKSNGLSVYKSKVLSITPSAAAAQAQRIRILKLRYKYVSL